ncbi:hypothetical protein M413DRAFT_439215 [Hebeloma cylindrosporum]|uniref:CHAT domain-containing protein n=1 Tax=Hebeloma cylindrosporum TaxID=76867 RepID=A0A0C3CUI5_HEBCY|nr:hypothetical protein M413DRAFT_439215 [Hebeloma cylindrosporum h7]
MDVVASDSYDRILICSIYWESDDTEGANDCHIFLEAVSKLQNVKTLQRILLDNDRTLLQIGLEIEQAASESEDHRLIILHYAGHAIADSTPTPSCHAPGGWRSWLLPPTRVSAIPGRME